MSERGAEHGRAFLDALLASAPNAIVWVDEDVRVTGINPSFERLFGFAANEAIGKPLYDLIVRGEERAHARELVRRARDRPVIEEVERYHKDGHPISVRMSAAPATGEAEGSMLIVYDDITEVIRAEQAVRDVEEEYRELVESASDLVWRVDSEGNWTFLNAACTRIYGVDPDRFQLRRRALAQSNPSRSIRFAQTRRFRAAAAKHRACP